MSDVTRQAKNNCNTQIVGNNTDDKVTFVLALLVFTTLIILNLSRMFDNNFWSDEIYSINTAHMTYSQIIDYAMNIDSHPPLYNLYMSVLGNTIGFRPFVYHLTSLIAYIGIMLIGLTFVRKKYGSMSGIVFMILATFLDSSMYFIPEARMYELGALFVLLSFVFLFNVIETESKRSYALFVLASLAAAYTHYYAMLAVAFFYVFLIIYFVGRHQWKSFKRFFIFGVITVLGYLPWAILSLFKTVEKDTSGFWIEDTLSVYKCFEYLFSSSYGSLLLLVFIIAIVMLFINNVRKIKKSDNYDEPKLIKTETIWVIAGLFSIIGSIIFGQVLSAITTPLVIVRYLYPVSAIAWLLFAISIRHLDSFKFIKNKSTVVTIVVLLILLTPSFFINLQEEFNNNQSTLDVIACVNDNTEDGDTILTDMNHMDKTMGGYYYPNLKTVYFTENKLPQLHKDEHYILYLDNSATIGKLEEQIAEQGYTVDELVYKKSFASAYTVFIYDLIPVA